jgi:polysaccharide biosynthesis protein PelA
LSNSSRQQPLSARARVPLLTSFAFVDFAIRAALAGVRGASHDQRFLVYYGRAGQDTIRRYDLAVLDSEIEGEIPPYRRPGGMLLGYLSLGEIHGGRGYSSELDREGLLLGPSPHWPEARIIDMRAARWRDRVVTQLVPDILARGFDGLLFDTLDNAEALERRDPTRLAGMVEGAAELVRAVRRSFPKVPIMINRGYAVLPRIAGQFDMLLGESVRATFDAGSHTYRMVPEDGFTWQVERMRMARERDRRLRLFSLDYWNPEDQDGIGRIYALQRANGFVPYVATFDLTRIVSEP